MNSPLPVKARICVAAVGKHARPGRCWPQLPASRFRPGSTRASRVPDRALAVGADARHRASKTGAEARSRVFREGAENCARGGRAPRCRAFSLIEIIVVVGLMSVIILGLVMMFGQTQRAYKLGTTQVDVLEGGRAVTDMITREMLQIAPANHPAGSEATNFATTVLPAPYYPLVQELSGSKLSRTNVLQDLFFLSRENQEWSGIGYVVRTNHPVSGVTGIPTAGMGTLYRFEAKHPTAFFASYPNSFGVDYQNAILNASNLTKIIEGVVHLTVRTFDSDGRWINFDHPNVYGFEMAYPTNQYHPDRWITNEVRLFSFASGLTRYGEIGCYFRSNAVPATVELELGILEDATLAKAKAIPDPARRYDYLTNQVSRVHLFRIRVPIRNVDHTAYQ